MWKSWVHFESIVQMSNVVPDLGVFVHLLNIKNRGSPFKNKCERIIFCVQFDNYYRARSNIDPRY